MVLDKTAKITEIPPVQQKTLVERIDKTAKANVAVTLKQCEKQLFEIQHQDRVSEIIAISPWHMSEKRQLSYQMLAEV